MLLPACLNLWGTSAIYSADEWGIDWPYEKKWKDLFQNPTDTLSWGAEVRLQEQTQFSFRKHLVSLPSGADYIAHLPLRVGLGTMLTEVGSTAIAQREAGLHLVQVITAK